MIFLKVSLVYNSIPYPRVKDGRGALCNQGNEEQCSPGLMYVSVCACILFTSMESPRPSHACPCCSPWAMPLIRAQLASSLANS